MLSLLRDSQLLLRIFLMAAGHAKMRLHKMRRNIYLDKSQESADVKSNSLELNECFHTTKPNENRPLQSWTLVAHAKISAWTKICQIAGARRRDAWSVQLSSCYSFQPPQSLANGTQLLTAASVRADCIVLSENGLTIRGLLSVTRSLGIQYCCTHGSKTKFLTWASNFIDVGVALAIINYRLVKTMSDSSVFCSWRYAEYIQSNASVKRKSKVSRI